MAKPIRLTPVAQREFDRMQAEHAVAKAQLQLIETHVRSLMRALGLDDEKIYQLVDGAYVEVAQPPAVPPE